MYVDLLVFLPFCPNSFLDIIMTAVQSMSTFVFPERPQKSASNVLENPQPSSSNSPAPPSNSHTSSSSVCSSEIPAISGFYASPSDSGYLNLNFTSDRSANLNESSSSKLPPLDSVDSREFYPHLKAVYSTPSVNYLPKSVVATDDFNATLLRDEGEVQPHATPQPFPPLQHPINAHSRQSSNFNIESTEFFEPSTTSNPIQEAYRCLTTPSALHPSPCIPPLTGSIGNRNTQRQSSFSSPSKSFKQQLTQPQTLQKQFRTSQPLPSSLNTSLPQQYHNQLPVRCSSPGSPSVSIETLIQLDIQFLSGTVNATDAALRLTQLLVYNNIVNRLQHSMQTFHALLSDRVKIDAAKFSSSYLQAIDYCSSILNNDYTGRGTNFMPVLKASNRRLLNSFLTLVKTSPSFICASLSTMNDHDVAAFYAPSSNDPLDDLTSLHRGNALDIIFYSFFPSVASPSQRFKYFAFIVSFIFDNFPFTEKFEKFSMAIFDRIMGFSSMNHLSSLETILLGFLQDGQFLLNYSTPPHSTPLVLHPISLGSPSTPLSTVQFTSSAPTSTYPSPEMSAMSLPMNVNSPINVLGSPFSSTATNSSPSILLQRATATAKATTHSHSGKTLSNPPPFIDGSDPKRVDFLNDAVSQILGHLNNSSTDAIPDHLIYFYKLVLSRVSEKNRSHSLHFIFFKHFFGKYIHSFFNSPESIGIAVDFYISEKQRQRILLAVYNALLYYAEVVISHKSSTTSVPPEIQTMLMSIYERFSTVLNKVPSMSINVPSSAVDDASDTNSADIFNSMDTSAAEGAKNYTGQLLVLSPSDVLTLYSSLFPSFALQRKNSFASHMSVSVKPITVERSGSSASGHAVNRSSSSSFGHTQSGSAPSTIGGASGGAATITNPLNESLPSLDEINLYFPDESGSAKSTPIFGPEDELFEWNLNDIRLDIEPVAEELLKKFPHLQFRGPVASQYLHSLRPQKLQHFRLPHPLSEKWQVFQVDENNLVTNIDEDSIVSDDGTFDNLDGGPLKFANSLFDENPKLGANSEDSHYVDFEKSPIAPGHRAYAEVVSKSLENFISETSTSIFNLPNPRNHFQYHTTANLSDVFHYISGRPESGLRSLSTKSNRIFNGDSPFTTSISSHSPASPTYLSGILTDAGHRAIASGNFLRGSEYFNAVHALQRMLPSASNASYAQIANDVNVYLIKCLKRDRETKLRNLNYRINKCEEIAQPHQIFLQFSCNSCDSTLGMLHDLRTKIWYMTEVRTSSLWSRARDIAVALNRGTGGGPGNENIDSPGSHSLAFGRNHSLKRNSSTTSLSSSGAFSSFKRFTGVTKREYQAKRQSMSYASISPADAMFAPVEYAGQNKLSDREAEATKKWLDGQQIQNFCTGEERIHRFSCEVDDLVKRVIGDALSGRRNRGQSLLTSSVLFKDDLWKLILELEGIDRSSGAANSMPGPYPSKASFYNFGAGGNGSANFEVDSDVTNRRRSTDSLSIDGFNPSHMRSKTSSSNHSELARSYSLRGHKSRKSSPNLIDMFTSSLDLSNKRMSSSDLHLDSAYERPSSSNEHLGHRRNRSLNEISVSGSGPQGNLSLPGSDDLGVVPMYSTEVNREEHDKKREELDQFLLELQMRLTSLIYTDLGLEGWSNGEFFVTYEC